LPNNIFRARENLKIKAGIHPAGHPSKTNWEINMTQIPNLTGRLACACNLAYAVNGSDVLGQNATIDDYLLAGGLPDDSETISDGTGINACRIWLSPDGIVAAFRGTLPPLPNPILVRNLQVLGDWVQNLDLALEDAPWLSGIAPGTCLHSGFKAAMDSIWPNVAQTVSEISRKTGETRIRFTGHSKGGAMATIAALRWVLEKQPAEPVQVVTFGAPRAGNQAFARFYNDQRLIIHERFEFGFDLVPHVPLTSIALVGMVTAITLGRIKPELRQDYAHVGALRYYDSNGTCLADSDQLAGQRGLRLVYPFPPSPDRLIKDHFVWSTKGQAGYLTCVSPPGYWA
jgi:Lipase (class 3)